MPNPAVLVGLSGFVITIINAVIVPLIFAAAFLVFLWGVYTYFFLAAGNDEKRKEGRTFIMYGIIGFFIMVSVWGLVNILVGTFGFNRQTRPPLPTFGQPGGGDFGMGGQVGGQQGGAPGSTGQCGFLMWSDGCGIGHDCINGQCYPNNVGSGGEACVNGQCTGGHVCGAGNICMDQ